MLCAFLFVKVSSQGGCVSDVCLWCAYRRERGKRGHWKHPFSSSGGGLLSCYRETALSLRGFTIHHVFCCWIKVEEAKYLAQIYAGSLTLRTNHPRAKSPFPSHLSREQRTEGERKWQEESLETEWGWRGGWEQGRRESELRLRATLCIAEREGKTHGRELGREGGCLCIAANCTGSPTLCCSHGSTPPPFKTFTGEREGYEIIVLRNRTTKVWAVQTCGMIQLMTPLFAYISHNTVTLTGCSVKVLLKVAIIRRGVWGIYAIYSDLVCVMMIRL